jgi:2-(1,2-epoxy-1,2-dihydrophenyl)acetyl-CoA isomerase
MLVRFPVMADVEVDRRGAVLTITLNRPEVLNALNTSLHAGLAAALEQARDPAIRAVVITGAGRGFCVGQDLQEFRGGARDVADRLRTTYHPNVLAIRALEKPVIAAINGPAAGAGLSLALACDARIAAESAKLVPAFVDIGLVPDSGGTWLVRRLLGTARGFEWLSTGRRLEAGEALAWGLVSEVVSDDELPARAHEVAELFAAMPTRAVWETKRLLDAAETTTFAEQLELEARTQAQLVRTPDFREGVAAFLEKRESKFSGQPPPRPHPVQLVVNEDLKRWRLTMALRGWLALPHLFVLVFWVLLAIPVGVVNWLIALVNGRPAAGLTAWSARLVRYQTHVFAYLRYVADPYPGFRGWAGTYPVDVDIEPAERQARWKTLLRIVLVLPALVFCYVLDQAVSIVSFLGLLFALVMGRYPRGFRDFSAYYLRFQAQTWAYLLLVTDRYPALAHNPPPVSSQLAPRAPASDSGTITTPTQE